MNTHQLPHPDYPARPPELVDDPLEVAHDETRATVDAAVAEVDRLSAIAARVPAKLARNTGQRLGTTCAFCDTRAVTAIAAMRLCPRHLELVQAIATDAGCRVTITHHPLPIRPSKVSRRG